MKQIVLVMITLFLSVSASYAQTADETDKNSANTIVTSRTKENSIKELEIVSKLYLNEKLEKEYKLEELF